MRGPRRNLAIVILCSFGLFPPNLRAELAVSGVVERRAGYSYIERGDKRTKVILDTGVRLFDKDKVHTEKGRVHIRFRDGTLAELGEHSNFEVDRVFQRQRDKMEGLIPLHRADESVYRFNQGILRVTAIEVDGFHEFTLKTDYALIHVVEPSDFLIARIGEKKQYEIRLLSGTVKLINIITNEVQELKSGFAAVMKSNGLVHTERRLSEEEVSFLKNRTGI